MFHFLLLALICTTSIYCQEAPTPTRASSAPLLKRPFLPPLKNPQKPSNQELSLACIEIDNAITRHDLTALTDLLKRYPSLVNARDVDDYNTTFLMQAALQGKARICRLLLEHGADITLQDDEGMTAALHAAQEHPSENLLFDVLYTYGAENVNEIRKRDISVAAYLKIRDWVKNDVCKSNHWTL